jgi:hypothetical protein
VDHRKYRVRQAGGLRVLTDSTTMERFPQRPVGSIRRRHRTLFPRYSDVVVRRPLGERNADRPAGRAGYSPQAAA